MPGSLFGTPRRVRDANMQLDTGELDSQRQQLWVRNPSIPADVGVRVDAFVRSLVPPSGAHETQAEIIERLSALGAFGVVEDSTVSIWGRRLCECETCAGTRAGRAVLDRLWEFETWEREQDADVELPFDRREVHSEFTGSVHEVVVPPRVLLAVYGDSTLLGVFPCEVEGEVYTARDGLVALDATTSATDTKAVEHR